ncbi:ATP-grasp domain-containing protein [Glycomyces xiaoerkulensis]|uniref:ATP-grasp domain-containing protein n=1 Tax=Glycomyces xiaoerkulensis TaxID=2038139 RepID=UPI000C25F4C4|nr:ATP-grasp domain-containing protein [Glycomyces xiaoerkulensis]
MFLGFSRFLLSSAEAVLPPASVYLVEEPEIIETRNVLDAAEHHECVAAVLPAPVQHESSAEELPSMIERPADLTAVVPATEYGVVAAAALAEAWGLRGLGLRAARTLRDKLRLRRTAAGSAIAQPQWRRVESAVELERQVAAWGGHAVLKPAGRQASLGVNLIDPATDLRSAWDECVGADEPRLRARGTGEAQYMVEQRLRGPEFSVEMLVRDSAPVYGNVTAKTVLPGRYPVELGHAVPAPIEPELERRLLGDMGDLIAAAGVENGVLHAEWIRVDGVPHLIECAGRLPGDNIHRLIDLAYDTDIVADLLAVLDAKAPAPPARAPVRHAAIGFVTAAPGTVRSVSLPDRERHPDLVELSVGVREGDAVGPLRDSWGRLGYAIATGPDAAAAARTLESVLAEVAIVSE